MNQFLKHLTHQLVQMVASLHMSPLGLAALGKGGLIANFGVKFESSGSCVERCTTFAARSGVVARGKAYFAGVLFLGASAAASERSGPEVLAQGPLLLPLPKEAEVLEAGALFHFHSPPSPLILADMPGLAPAQPQ